ncbi:cytochrome b [Maliponia aquimaris]|uniref:Cytochrome b562 n=1 Tax=Maliponia aquimaris TaxID=1673631 RepID=A0A238K820_9RHOB|nr:cytochrome b/b6 domain-containing protein [Maliponia aquimaris]SMX39040.1 Cytochrome b562 [Maliponia aquimaris]
MARREGYSAVQIGLHWLTAVLILGAYLLSDGMGDALRARVQSGATGTEGNTLHVWLGGAAFLVILIRIVVRRVMGAPEAPAGTPPLWEKAATWGHRLLYALMVLVPLGGALTWYGGLPLGDGHEIAGTALMLVAGGHAVAAMLHEALRRDGTMSRMLHPRD